MHTIEKQRNEINYLKQELLTCKDLLYSARTSQIGTMKTKKNLWKGVIEEEKKEKSNENLRRTIRFLRYEVDYLRRKLTNYEILLQKTRKILSKDQENGQCDNEIGLSYKTDELCELIDSFKKETSSSNKESRW